MNETEIIKNRGLSAETTHEEAVRVSRETYEKFNDALYHYILARSDSQEDAEDLAQEVHLRVMQKLRKQQAPSFSFLRTIAANLLKDRRRKQHVRKIELKISAAESERLPSTATSTQQFLESKQLYMLFKKVIENVKPESRQAFVLHRFDGLTYNEIAREMKISSGMVKKHIQQVALQFRKKMVKSYGYQR